MIYNLTKKNIIARNPKFLHGISISFCDSINKKFRDFDAVVWQNHNAFYNFFSRSKKDIIFVDINNSVCKIAEYAGIFNVIMHSKTAIWTICLPSGEASRKNIEVGDKVDLSAELTATEKANLMKRQGIIPSVPTTMIKFFNLLQKKQTKILRS